MVFDPNAIGPGGEGVFWQVEEMTKPSPTGSPTPSSDESTTWNALANVDSLPYYINYSAAEGECEVPPGVNCSVTVNAPANLQSGDVVIAFVDMGGQFPVPPTPSDSTWTALPIMNMTNNPTSMQSGSCNGGDIMTEYAYAHIYGNSTEGPYKFKHIDEHYCSGTYNPEMEGFLVGYRSASSNTASYVLNGYPAGQVSYTVTVGAAPTNSPSDGTLLNVFWGSGFENLDYGEYGNLTFSSLTGTPAANPETPLAPPNTLFLLADVGIPSSNSTLAQYSVTTCTLGGLGQCVPTYTKFGWQLFLPEQ